LRNISLGSDEDNKPISKDFLGKKILLTEEEKKLKMIE